ncbi:hypothetical protein Tsubulata_047565 [Turnera subulata]|uniref:Uncharacterized protein n=1 Tax=Turnera subulata TaxID=218843 RepID=A0A9Q0J4T3_9ROSI|nr:hypothetical protein Tsubulata_047565 [Turnera subulata]
MEEEDIEKGGGPALSEIRCGEEFGRLGQHTRAYRPSAPSPPPPCKRISSLSFSAPAPPLLAPPSVGSSPTVAPSLTREINPAELHTRTPTPSSHIRFLLHLPRWGEDNGEGRPPPMRRGVAAIIAGSAGVL